MAMRLLATGFGLLLFGLSATMATAEAVTESHPVDTNSQRGTSPQADAKRVTLGGVLVEDLNGNGQRDDDDGPPTSSTLVELIPWSIAERGTVPLGEPKDESNFGDAGIITVLRVFTAKDGSFAFTNAPPGDYTLAIWWQAGFYEKSTPGISDVVQVVVSVSEDGTVGSPASIPERFPGVIGEQQGEDKGVGFIGVLPGEILLKKIAQGFIPYPVSSGAPGLPPVEGGALDVGRALNDSAAAPALPGTGQGSSSYLGRHAQWFGALGLVGLLALCAGGIYRSTKKRFAA